MFTEGCQQKFSEFIKDNLALIGAVAIVIAFIQVSIACPPNAV